ncbi:MAG: hypothetical protein OEY70_16185 [Acidimicrobiia bacterium]|nr:hypothetical protein [Acidimicrobiia bacterium]
MGRKLGERGEAGTLGRLDVAGQGRWRTDLHVGALAELPVRRRN